MRLYGREGCGLCGQARAMLERMRGDFGFEIEDVDIEADAALHDRFFLEIPVVEIAGEVIASAPLSERTLREAIEDALDR